MIKMNIRKQLDEFKQIVKAPPIENPRKENDWDTSNDDLDMAGFKKLFEDVADPIIEKVGKGKRRFAVVPFEDLKMSKKKALEVAKELYAGKGYTRIANYNDGLNFQLQE